MAPAPTRVPLTGRLVYSAERNGRWDLYASSPEGSPVQQLTSDGSSRSPSISSDGKRIAFESHRDGNWEIYAADGTGTNPLRLTKVNAYDGQPSWSPDGSRLAFTSSRTGDLDVWLMNADGSSLVELTPGSTAVETSPAWSPDGRWIAFTSWRTGTAQIFVISPDGKDSLNISQNQFDDLYPAWSPNGKQIAFASDRDGQRGVYVADFSSAGLSNVRRLTFSGWDDRPVWSPGGEYIAFISIRPSHQSLYSVLAIGGMPTLLTENGIWVRSAAWASISSPLAPNVSADAPLPTLYARPSDQTAAKLVPLKDVYLDPSWGEMSDRVSASFQALRARVKTDAGWDFLSVLSDMTRQLTGGVCGDGCQILSWHKSGRAVDTRLAVDSGGGALLEIVREDQLGETYWRVYLRASKQDGTQGEPLTEAPWDWTHRARWTLAPHQGGVPKAIPSGYYVDFTELARIYGWRRISSYDDNSTLSWKENNLGMEFWHFQNTNGMSWYTALRELYSRQTLATAFDWNALVRQKQDPYLLVLKDMPAPRSAWRWYALFADSIAPRLAFRQAPP